MREGSGVVSNDTGAGDEVEGGEGGRGGRGGEGGGWRGRYEGEDTRTRRGRGGGRTRGKRGGGTTGVRGRAGGEGGGEESRGDRGGDTRRPRRTRRNRQRSLVVNLRGVSNRRSNTILGGFKGSARVPNGGRIRRDPERGSKGGESRVNKKTLSAICVKTTRTPIGGGSSITTGVLRVFYNLVSVRAEFRSGLGGERDVVSVVVCSKGFTDIVSFLTPRGSKKIRFISNIFSTNNTRGGEEGRGERRVKGRGRRVEVFGASETDSGSPMMVRTINREVVWTPRGSGNNLIIDSCVNRCRGAGVSDTVSDRRIEGEGGDSGRTSSKTTRYLCRTRKTSKRFSISDPRGVSNNISNTILSDLRGEPRGRTVSKTGSGVGGDSEKRNRRSETGTSYNIRSAVNTSIT